MEPLNDDELNTMLRRWEAPPAPRRLRDRLFPEAPWWRRWWHTEIRVPVPVAVCLILLLFAGLWQWSRTSPPRPPSQSADVVTFRELRPVQELKPRIIRRQHDRN